MLLPSMSGVALFIKTLHELPTGYFPSITRQDNPDQHLPSCSFQETGKEQIHLCQKNTSPEIKTNTQERKSTGQPKPEVTQTTGRSPGGPPFTSRSPQPLQSRGSWWNWSLSGASGPLARLIRRVQVGMTSCVSGELSGVSGFVIPTNPDAGETSRPECGKAHAPQHRLRARPDAANVVARKGYESKPDCVRAVENDRGHVKGSGTEVPSTGMFMWQHRKQRGGECGAAGMDTVKEEPASVQALPGRPDLLLAKRLCEDSGI